MLEEPVRKSFKQDGKHDVLPSEPCQRSDYVGFGGPAAFDNVLSLEWFIIVLVPTL